MNKECPSDVNEKINNIIKNLNGHQIIELCAGLIARASYRITKNEGKEEAINALNNISSFTTKLHIEARKTT